MWRSGRPKSGPTRRRQLGLSPPTRCRAACRPSRRRRCSSRRSDSCRSRIVGPGSSSGPSAALNSWRGSGCARACHWPSSPFHRRPMTRTARRRGLPRPRARSKRRRTMCRRKQTARETLERRLYGRLSWQIFSAVSASQPFRSDSCIDPDPHAIVPDAAFCIGFETNLREELPLRLSDRSQAC